VGNQYEIPQDLQNKQMSVESQEWVQIMRASDHDMIPKCPQIQIWFVLGKSFTARWSFLIRAIADKPRNGIVFMACETLIDDGCFNNLKFSS